MFLRYDIIKHNFVVVEEGLIVIQIVSQQTNFELGSVSVGQY